MTMDIGRDPRVIAAFSKRKMLHRTLMYLAYIPVIFAVIVRWRPDLITLGSLPWGTLFGLSLGLGVLLLISSYFVLRCPACHKFIGFNRHAVACPHCKANFVNKL